jgi:hypothetical protein
MLVVETIAQIRRASFVQQKPIKAVCRELRVAREVVRKVARSDATSLRYEREQQLSANEAKPSRDRLTLIRIFEDLRGVEGVGKRDQVAELLERGHRILLERGG